MVLANEWAESRCSCSPSNAEHGLIEAAGSAAGAWFGWKLAIRSGGSGSEAGEGGEVQVGAAVGAAAGWLVGPAGTMLRASSACP